MAEGGRCLPFSLCPILCGHLWGRLKSLFDRSIERSCLVAQTSQKYFSPRDTDYSLKPVTSTFDGDVAVFDMNTIEKTLSTGITWHDTFRYHERLLAWAILIYCINSALEYFSYSNPISVKRSLRGSCQAWRQLELEAVITNQCKWSTSKQCLGLLQFYLVNGTKTDGIVSNISE